MPSRRDKLLSASWRGVEFLVTSESMTDAGRKVVLHEYPDSNQRFVEDLGQLPGRFRVQAFVTGDDWLDRSNALETALNKAGQGILVMPTMGSRRLYALPYTKDASQTSVGIITFNLDFAAGKPSDAPAQIATTQQEVFEKGDDSRGIMQKIFGDDYETPEFITNIETAIGDVKDSVSDVVAKIQDQIDIGTLQQLNQKAQRIAARIPQLIQDPEGLAFELIQGTTSDPGIWQLASLGFGVTGTISSLKILADYGESLLTSETADTVTSSAVNQNDTDETSDTTPYWTETTEEREDRNTRRRLIVRSQRLNAMVAMYEQLAAGEYSTTEEIQTAKETVEAVYEQIMLDGTQNNDAFQSNQELRLSIEDVRRASLEVLDEKDQQVFGLVTVDQNVPTSKFVLSYNLYAEEFTNSTDLTDRSIVVGGLNPDQSGLQLDDTVTVLQNRVIT